MSRGGYGSELRHIAVHAAGLPVRRFREKDLKQIRPEPAGETGQTGRRVLVFHVQGRSVGVWIIIGGSVRYN